MRISVDTLKLPLCIPAAKNPDYDPSANLPILGRAWILGFLEGKGPGDFPPKPKGRKSSARPRKKAAKPRGQERGDGMSG